MEALTGAEPTWGAIPVRRGRRRFWRVGAAAVAVAGVLAYAAPADAADFLVTKTTDDVGPCLVADCSLRAAVLAANADPDADTITLPPGTYALTLPDGPGIPDSESGDLDIVGNVTIRKEHGAAGNVIVDGLGATRLIEVPYAGFSVAVTLERLRLDRGLADSFSGGGLLIGAPGSFILDQVAVTNSAGGGGIVVTESFTDVRLTDANVSDNVGGGISFLGTLRVLDSRISGNGSDWGGIRGDGTLEVYRSDLERNISSGSGGGIHLIDGTMVVEDSTIRENRADEGSGGGIRVSDGAEKLVSGSTIEDNDALPSGGGVYVADGTDLLVEDSTIRGNSSPSGGGLAVDGTLNLTHSTVSGNTSASSGGGLFIGSEGLAFLSHVTISANQSEFGGGIHNLGEQQWGLTVTAANPGGDCAGAAPTLEFASFVGTAGCGRASGDGDAMLGDLEANGGPTLTHLPRDGSPLIDGGEGFSCGPYDQRGFLPPDGRPCDIGAVEVEGEGDADLRLQKVDNVDPAELNGDLVYEIQLANDGPGRVWGAQLVDEIPLSEDVVSVTGGPHVRCEVTPRGEEGENGVRCKLGSIGAGQTEVVYIHVRPTTGGDILNEVTGSAGSTDPEPNNNTSDETTTVGFLVTNTEDSGPGSLRQAMLDANANPGEDVIAFSIPGGGVHKIVPATALPAITDQVRIDGYTQGGSNPNTLDVGNNAVILIEIDGNGGVFDGLRVVAGGAGSRIRGLVINDFNGDAIELNGVGGITIEGNYVGTNSAGDAAVPSRSAIYMQSSPGNLIGGLSPVSRNVLVAGQNYPIWTQTPDAAGGDVVIQNNYVGTNAQGAAVLGVSGITLSNAGNTIGGVLLGSRNVIANQGRPGIHLDESEANDNTIQGNHIGVTADGTGVLGNVTGVEIQRASGNLVGGPEPEAGNVIVGSTGVSIFGVSGPVIPGNTIEGNYIGTDATGSVALPAAGNAGPGVMIDSSQNNVVRGNVLSNHHTGVRILSQAPAASSNVVERNLIGTNAAGTAALPNNLGVFVGSTVGAPAPSADNRIGGTTAAQRNVISGNNTDGIQISGADGTIVQGNYVGVGSDGLTPIPNLDHGVEISSGTDTVVGGTDAGEGNLIAHNGNFFSADGVSVFSGTGNSIRGNSIHSNQQLGIDLAADGPTANDPGDGDGGPNNRQNFPLLTAATMSGGNLTVTGTIDSATATTYDLDFYVDACSLSGVQAARYVGSDTVITDDGGDASFDLVLPEDVDVGSSLTVTATDPAGNTSELGPCVLVDASGPTEFTVDSAADTPDANVGDGACATELGECTLRAAVEEANAVAGRDTILLPTALSPYELDGGLPITGEMRIVGENPGLVTIRQTVPDLIFDIAPGGGLELFDVRLEGGQNDLNGGAIANRGGLSVFRSQFVGNTSSTSGGALWNRGAASISNSTFDGNTAGMAGGAIYVEEGGVLDLINVTVSGNRVVTDLGRGGGGLVNDGTATLNHVTFSGNASRNGAETFDNGGSATVTNTAFAADDPAGDMNMDFNCAGSAFDGGSNFVALFNGFGWSSDPSCTALSDDVTGDPALGLLADNGGGVFTHLPGTGSALIDNARAMSVSPTDARGVPRPEGVRADIGAVEALDAVPPDTRITAGPFEGTMTSHTGAFEFESPDDPAATFECSLDGSDFTPCTSPYEWELPDGVHSFAVRARDAATNVDLTPALRSWVIYAGDGSVPSVLQRISTALDGSQLPTRAIQPAISGDARFVAFTRERPDEERDDVWIRDRASGALELISAPRDPDTGEIIGLGDGNSSDPAISSDGRYVSFTSSARNLVEDDGNNTLDVFRFDRQTNTMERATLHSGGGESSGGGFQPAMSGDGRYIAFVSHATDLVAGDTNGQMDVFLRDVVGGTTERVSVDSAEAQASGGYSEQPSISADGRYVAFHSGANNLAENDTNEGFDVFVRDRAAGSTAVVSLTDVAAISAVGNHLLPSISDDGRFVAFQTDAEVFTHGASIASVVRDRTAGRTTLIELGAIGPAISGDGTHVAYTNGRHGYVMQRATLHIEPLDVTDAGDLGNASTFSPSISDSGVQVAFASSSTNLVPDDTNNQSDVFARRAFGPIAPPIFVTDSSDSDDARCGGACSLREAMTLANQREGGRIHFAIEPGGHQVITPASPLPDVLHETVVDGTTQGGWFGPPLIELDGSQTSDAWGLLLNSPGGGVRALAIHSFTDNLWLVGSDHQVTDSYLGFRPDGTLGSGQRTGIAVYSSRAQILDNVIAGNTIGVHVTQSFDGIGDAAVIRGNKIGTDVTGQAPRPNGTGIVVESAPDVVIGGTGPFEGNVVSGNSLDGIVLQEQPTTNTSVRGNLIGIGNDSDLIGNGADGIRISDGASDSAISGNTITDNAGAGVALTGCCSSAPLRNAITDNSIYDNGGLAIDINSDGVTPNGQAAADQANQGQDFPLLVGLSAVTPGGSIFADGTVTEVGPEEVVRIDVYATDDCDPSGLGELETLIGNRVGTVPGGLFSVELTGTIGDGQVLSATLTDSSGNTSEASPCLGDAPTVEASVSISAGAASVQAGVSDVAIADVPLEDIVPRATAEAHPGSATANATTDPEGAPLGGIPLGGIPLGGIDLARSPLGGIPLGGIGLDDAAYQAVLSRVILSSLPISVPGGWMAVLEDTRFKGVPPQSLTLGQVLGDSDGATAIQALSFGQVDLAASPLGGIPLGGITLGGTPLGGISILGNTGAQNLADWCTLLREEADFACAATNPAVIEDETLLSLGLRGVPLGGIPLGGIPLGGIPLGGIPLGGIPLGGIPLGGIPLGGIPLGGIPLGGIPLGGIPLGGIPFTGPNASPLGGIPLGGIANVQAIVDCTAVDCLNGTLADAAGHFTDAAKLSDLQGVLAGYTLADLKFYGELTLADIEDLIPADMTLGELLRVLLRRSEFPWEEANLGGLDLQGLSANASSLPLTASFSVSGAGSLDTTVDVEAELPPGFRYLPGTSLVRNTVDDPPFSALADPVVTGNTLRWTVSSVPFLTPHEVRFQAQPGTTLGLAEATAAATPDGGSRAVAADPASVVVGDTFEPNDGLESAHAVENDHLYFSYVADGDDRDYFEFPSPAAGTRIDVYVSQLTADVDAVLYAPERTVLAPGAVEGIPSGVALGDEGVDLDGSQDRRSPETLRDVPLVAGEAIAGISANRGRETEEIHTVARGTGMYRIQLSGYNGAVTEQPYVLRIVFRQPLIPSCPDRDFPHTGAAASAPAGYDPALNTLFVVNQQRLGATYGATAAADVTAAAQALAGRADLGVVGGILAVEADAATQQLYGTWDGNPCDPNAANAVMSRIVERVNGIAATHPQLKNIVLVGGDDIVPMARIPDLTRLYNEREHAGSVSNLTNEYFGAFVTEHLLSDDTYGDRDPIRHLDRQLFVPERAVGRLVEQPAAIEAALERFGHQSVQGHVDPQSALVSGYDFLTDGANAIKSDLAANGQAPIAANLINDQWTRAQLRDALLPPNNAAAPGIASINAHFDQTRALPALGNTQADESDLFTTADLNGAMGRLIGGVVFSMGCHAGLNMSDIAVGTTVPDWAERLGQEGALFAGNTGYGLGDTEVVAYSERLMELFAERLDGSMTVGEALTFAKQAYYAEHGVFGVYDEKVMAEAVFYGLPMYTLGTPGAPQQPDPPDVGPPSLEPISGLQASPLSFQASLLPAQNLPTFEPDLGDRGTHYQLDGKVQVTHGRPIQPRAEFQVEQPGTLAHGFLVTDLASTDLLGIDPVFARPTGDLEANEPEPTSNDVAFPGKHATVVTYQEPQGRKQRLNLVAGQFFDDGVADPLGLGTQRLFTEISGSVLYSDSQDFVQPQIDDVEGAIVGSTASFALDAVDPARGADGIRRVVVLYHADGESAWRRAELIRTPGSSRWTGGGPAVGTHVEYVVQAVDADGDIGVSSEKARYFDARPQEQPPTGVDFELDGPAGDGGWYRGDVTVELEGARQYRVDGGGFVPYEGAFVVEGDGVHSVEVQDNQGAITSVVVPIDATSPTAVITTPADGGTYPLGENVPADYECIDGASGVDGCTGTVAVGAPIDTGSRGAKSFSVTATDVAGNPAVVVTSHYTVNRRPTAPGAPVAVPTPNPGVFTLSWTPATDADDEPLTYTLEHKDANDAGFTQVATGLTATTFAFTAAAPESEGTQVYRVRASDGSEPGPFSADSAAVVVDKTPPNVPLLQANRAPDFAGGGGWYKPPVTVTTVAQGDPALADGSPGSGVALVSPPQTVSTTSTQPITGAVADAAGNSREGSLAVKVDADAPLVAISCPASVPRGSVASATWSATDLHSGLATPATGTLALNTTTPGLNTAVSPVARDNVGNTGTATCTYMVTYVFSGFLWPVKAPPVLNLWLAGFPLPLRFRLGGNQGLDVIADTYPRFKVIPCGSAPTDPLADEEETSDFGLFYLREVDQYVYTWKTLRTWRGTCRQFILQLRDGTTHTANFKFK